MREKDIVGAINGIYVKPSVKTKIMDLNSYKLKPKARINLKKPVALAVAFLLVCSLSFGIPFLYDRNDPDSLYEGLVIKAYAANGEEITLSPNDAIPLKEYSPTMSSVPGIPFNMEFIRMEVDEIQVSVDKGTLSTWKSPNGIVENKGNFYKCQAGETIYWSPLSEDGALIGQSKLTVTAIKNGDEIIKAEILIKKIDDSRYSAEIVSLMSNPKKVEWKDLNM